MTPLHPANLLFILSDEHNRGVTGCYGNARARTPNLDALARSGTIFENAYTPCPICVPARASLATGRYVHRTGNWDNAFPYDGSVPGWHHRLREQGFTVASIGKLHFRSAEDDNGFSEEIDPLHVAGGVGDLLSCLRGEAPPRNKRPGILEAGPGDSSYLNYDARIARRAVEWMREHARDTRPWVLFVSFVCPHPPYIAPPRLFAEFDPAALPLPNQWHPDVWPRHPALDWMRRQFGYGEVDEALLRRVTAAYYGACAYLDERIGELLAAMADLDLEHRTRILYTSDHGECLGARGLFGKFTMYEESAAIPLILSGPDVPRGRRALTPASLVDCFRTALQCVGALAAPEDAALSGASLWDTARDPETRRERAVFSEYHAVNSRSGIFMLRDLEWKYVHYVNDAPQLFNVLHDPQEVCDLAELDECRPILERYEHRLRELLAPETPESIDARAKADQRAKVEAFGGPAAVIRRGTFDNSPPPGEDAVFH